MEERDILRLVETQMLSDLEEARIALVQGEETKFKLPGVSPGEKMAYLAAAIWIVQKIKQDKCDFKAAFTAYQQEIKEH